MIPLRNIRRLFSNKQVIPKAPQLLSGQLQPFRFQVQNAQLFDGYTLDQLYGVKMGIRHPPSVRAEMQKDSIAALALFGVGIAIILHIDWLYRQQYAQIEKTILSKYNRDVGTIDK